MKQVGESLEVTLQYGGIKGERMWSSKHDAISVLLADLVTLRVHRPKGENIRQEGATFFLTWYHNAYAPTPLERGTLYPRWRDIVLGNPELNATKKMLSIESVTLSRYHGDILVKMLGPASSSLGPKHTIEPPRTDAMNSRTGLNLWHSPSTGRPHYSQRPYLVTDMTREKRPRSNSIHEQDLSRSVGNEEYPPAHLQKRIRIESNPHSQSSPVEGRNDLNNAASRDRSTASEVRNRVPPSRPTSLVSPFGPRTSVVPPSRPPTSLVPSLASLSTNQREQCMSSSSDMESLSNLPGIGNRIVPTGPRTPERRESIKKHLLDLSNVRSGLATLRDREKYILEELGRHGVSPQPPQPKIEEINSSSNALEAQLMLVEVELQQEKKQRLRAEHTLAEVERECRSPFIVPALFQAFCRILDIGHVGAATTD